MKKIALVAAVLFVAVVLFVSSSSKVNSENEGNFKYIGVNKCVICHKTDAQGKQLDIWKSSKHSQAFTTLQSEAADKIAKDKGFTTKAAETPACVKCHVLGKDIVKDELTEDFKIEDGVQCESCHGPGSEYKAMSIMKDKQKAIENGLNVPSDKAQFCTGCHNPESPTYKEFKFDVAWEQIKHYKPKN